MSEQTNISAVGIMGVESIVRGRAARIYFTYPDGKRYYMGNFISFEAKVDHKKTKLNILYDFQGRGNVKGAPTNTITGSRYFNNSIHRKYLLEYAKNGKDLYYTITVINDDPSSNVGKQSIILTGCNDDSTVLAKFDADTEYLTEDFNATFEGWNMDDFFNDNAIANA